MLKPRINKPGKSALAADFGRRVNDKTSFYNYVAGRVGPSIPLLAAFAGVGMVFIDGVGIFAGVGSPVALWLQLLPLAAVLGVAAIARKPRRPAILRLLSLSCVVLLEIAFNLQGWNLAPGLPWVWPATLLVPVAATIAWIDVRDFTLGMALCAVGPIPMLWMTEQKGDAVLQYAVYMIVAVALSMVLRSFIKRMIVNQYNLEQKLREQVITDGLSGLLSRNGFLQRAVEALEYTRLKAVPSCVIYLDVDKFKLINDGFGHAAGDQVLVALASALRSHTRHTDLIGRIGGEEFAIMLPGAGMARAHGYAENLRRAVHSIPRPDGWLTISIGVTCSAPGDTESLEQMLARADTAMLKAKADGRDRIVLDQTGSNLSSLTIPAVDIQDAGETGSYQVQLN